MLRISVDLIIFQVVSDLKADQKIVDRLNDVGIRIAEGRNKTFHCITPDCTHWWFIEPEQANDMIYCYVIVSDLENSSFIFYLSHRVVNIGFV